MLNTPYALRRLLRDAKYHTYKGSIPKEEITLDAEPRLVAAISQLREQLLANPDALLVDSYTPEERTQDWHSLVQKPVLDATGEIIKLDPRMRAGGKLMDHSMRHFYDVQNYKGQSVRNSITAANLQKALEANVRMHSTPYKSEIRRMITMFCGMGSITKYKPLTAKALVQFFGSKRVLDPCAGWGGRMLGTLAAATDTVYVACEPDQKTHAALTEIVSHIGQEARTTLIHAPVESAWQTLAAMEPFDMILTSPPYFNLELYCEGEQSVQTFPEWSVWVREWLTPLIQGCLVRLKPTGVSCWSVKNFRSDKAYPLADVVKEIHERAGWRLVKTMGLKSSGRPGSKRIQDGKEAREAEEETFCFRR